MLLAVLVLVDLVFWLITLLIVVDDDVVEVAGVNLMALSVHIDAVLSFD